MGKVTFQISVSLDGFVAGPNQSAQNPIGEGGMDLHQWVFGLDAWRKTHGQEGGETNISSKVLDEAVENIGATVMGRNMFGPIRGPWDGDPWNGWWGDDPPFHHPVFVLTHHAREPVAMDGGTTFTFVTDGIQSALEQAKAAAGPDKDVSVAGGASAIQQFLNAGLVDDFELHVVPLLLGDGERLLDGVDVNLERTRVLESPSGVTHLKFRVVG
jgi:dihydrofolate reductase